MEDGIICIRKTIEKSEKELKEIRQTIEIESHNAMAKEAILVRKTDLKNYRCIIIEIKPRQGNDYTPIGIGLVDVRVDKEAKELIGKRLLKCAGMYEVQETRFNLNNYRKQWRAWTRIPDEVKSWN